ncbi:MAG TPA: hypothetical protein VKV80_05845 [Streptosporangiaceae bacterium]|nr:hypothetical protein [Streptosporangiaceae bacterium]
MSTAASTTGVTATPVPARPAKIMLKMNETLACAEARSALRRRRTFSLTRSRATTVAPRPVRPGEAGEGTRRDLQVDPGHLLLRAETRAQSAHRDGWLAHVRLPDRP